MIAAARGVVVAAVLGWGGCAANAAAHRPVQFEGIEPVPATLPSFDCTKAVSLAEKTICAQTLLGWADRRMAWAYERLHLHLPTAEATALRAEQRAWLKTRDACADEACVGRLVRAREQELNTAIQERDTWLRRGLAQVGACQVTRIDHIGDRFGLGRAPMGTTVGFANGVWLVGYSRVAPVLQSRLGDAARVCLVSLPRGCPEGDARGRIYSGTNLRTGGTWRMKDSQHSCGGA